MEKDEKKMNGCGCSHGCEDCNCCSQDSKNALDFFPKIPLKFENKSPNPDPSYAEDDDSCFDVGAWIDSSLYDEGLIEADKLGPFLRLKPMQCRLIHTGLYFEISGKGMEIQTRTRSGKALNNQIVVLNSPGTIDKGYRGEVGIILMNFGTQDFIIRNNDKIAQCGLYPVFNQPMVELIKVDKISTDTKRAGQAFGHSDAKK